MWEEIKEKFFQNKIFTSMKDVINQMAEVIIKYENTPEIIKSITGWSWIVESINAALKEN